MLTKPDRFDLIILRTSRHGIRLWVFDAPMLDDAPLLGNRVELSARLHAYLSECMAFMRREPLYFRQFVPRDFTWQTKVKRLTSAFARSMAGHCVGGSSSRAMFPRER
jgi:hypothetical protein